MIAPPLHHFDPLGPILAAIVDAANGVAVGMGKRPFDGIRAPFSGLVEQSRSGGPQAVGGHVVVGIAHAPERLIHGVFAHWAAARVEGREDEAGWPAILLQLDQIADHLSGQRDDMRSAHLHPLLGNFPRRRLEIEFAPIRHAQLAGARQDMRGNLESKAGDWRARISVDGPEQCANVNWIDQRRMVFHLGRD